ncbi:MAG: DsbA family protein [Acidobacteriota bacterium]|nr:DsbA family protein [Acidobacteriota bacterium]
MSADSKIVVAVDFRQPQSYLAIRPTRQLAKDLDVELDWRPFPVPAPSPPDPATEGERGSRHLQLRARYVEQDLQRYADVQGLVLGDIYRSPDTATANAGLLWAKRQSHSHGESASVDRYVDALFSAYWDGSFDIEDASAVVDKLEEAGIDADSFDPEALRGDVDRCVDELKQAGVVGAPAYLVADQLFIGRAHLPMIRWLLTDRQDAPPI